MTWKDSHHISIIFVKNIIIVCGCLYMCVHICACVHNDFHIYVKRQRRSKRIHTYQHVSSNLSGAGLQEFIFFFFVFYILHNKYCFYFLKAILKITLGE